jgi:peptidoglycan hydrolase CwlO-like protein
MSTVTIGEGEKGKVKQMPSDTPVVRVPVWLWTVMGIAVAFAFTHTVKQHVTDDRVSNLTANQKATHTQVEKLTDEVRNLSGPIKTVDGIAIDLREVRSLLREVRDDVLTLKAREESPMLKSN